jgi:hypothetical protein
MVRSRKFYWLIAIIMVIITALMPACTGKVQMPSLSCTIGQAPPSIPLGSVQNENLRHLFKSTAVRQNVSGYKLVEAVKALPTITAIHMPVGFDDSDDYWPWLLSLPPADQVDLGLASILPLTVTKPAPETSILRGGQIEPVYNIRVHVILCSNDDGTRVSGTDAMTPDFFTKVIEATNPIFYDAGIQFVFDPASDFEVRNPSTLLNQDFVIPPGTVLTTPYDQPPLTDQQINELKKPTDEERQRVAKEYRGKMVLMLCDGTMLVYDDSLAAWTTQPRSYAFSGENVDYVALPTGKGGSPQGWANMMAHEMGHYFHQWHPFVAVSLTPVEANDNSLTDQDKALLLKERAAQIIKNYIAAGNPVADGAKAFDGDISQVSDTPPDTAETIFRYVNGDECGPTGSVEIKVNISGQEQHYVIEPDRGNVVGYFKHCLNIPMHFSWDQIAGMRKAIAEENRWHLIGPPMRLHILNTYVVNNQPLYNAVWRPSTEGEIQYYGWPYEGFRAKYDELWDQGWRLHILNTYVVNNQPLYNAVWRPSTEGEIQVYGMPYEGFRAKYDELWDQGWRLHILDTYVINNQPLYNAVWRPSTEGEIQVYGMPYEGFRAKYDELWDQGWRLHILDTYVINNQPLYNAVWRPSTEGEIQVYGWPYEDFRAQYDIMW